jgi:hypothetical protein
LWSSPAGFLFPAHDVVATIVTRSTTGKRRDTASYPTHDFVLTSKTCASCLEDQSGERNSNPMF